MSLTAEIAAAARIDTSVLEEMMRATGLDAEDAAASLKKLGEALMESEADRAGPITYTNRAARRARARRRR